MKKIYLTNSVVSSCKKRFSGLHLFLKRICTFSLFLFFFVSVAMSQSKRVTGKVTDSDNGQALPGVTVSIEGTSVAAVSDNSGQYTIETSDSKATLLFSSVGFASQKIKIGNRSVIDVSLISDVKELEQVIVVGYGTQKKVNLTGAVDVVSNKVLENRSSASLGSLLQGVSPSLKIGITGAGGEPGAGNTFNIRGISSLSGSNSPLILVDGVEMSINNLDPESVESISVLKDAASAAIYGSRAASGVVLITTKKGSKNKGISIGYSNNFSSASPINLPEWQNSLRYVTAYNQSLRNSGQPDKFGPAQIDRIIRYIAGTYTPEYDTIKPPGSVFAGRHQGNANNEWYDIYFKDHTINQKHNINISGGDEKTQFYINAGMYEQGSSYNFAKEKHNRYNMLANITTKPTSWLRFDLNTKYAYTNSLHPVFQGDIDRTYILDEISKFYSVTPYYNVNGTVTNPFVNALSKAGPARGIANDLFITLGTEIEPIAGWLTNVRYSNNLYGDMNSVANPYIFIEAPNRQIYRTYGDNSFSQLWNNNNYGTFSSTTSYEKAIQNHFIKGMVGYENEVKKFSQISGSRNGLFNPDILAFNAANGTIQLGDGFSHWATEAYFGRLNYNYQEKYLFEVNARYNGSSRFAKESRWGFFPSVSAGYNISKESFWDPISNYVNNFKIRASYGSLGNQNVPNYLYLSNVPIGSNLDWIIDGQRPNYAGLPRIISPTLTWETINTLDFGVDADFFKNRLGLSFDWFKRNTLNMFGPAAILPASLGTSAPTQNNAALETKGFEVSLDWKDKIGSNLKYSAKFILADSRTKITKYLNTTGQIDGFYVGKDLGEIWGYTTAGLIQTAAEAASMPNQSYIYNTWGPGDVKYTDLNDDKKINDGARTLADHGDVRVIGNRLPRYSIGFNGTLEWKNFDFGMFWQGIIKRDIPTVSYYGSNMWGVGTQGNGGGAFYQGMDNYWRPADETNLFGPNTNGFYPKPYVSGETRKNQQVQTRYNLNGAYLRLKNIQLGYTLPKKITDKLRMQRLKIYFSGENLLTFDKLPAYIDPELALLNGNVANIYPLSRTISFGLNLNFK